jgi:hypothetical protein
MKGKAQADRDVAAFRALLHRSLAMDQTSARRTDERRTEYSAPAQKKARHDAADEFVAVGRSREPVAGSTPQTMTTLASPPMPLIDAAAFYGARETPHRAPGSSVLFRKVRVSGGCALQCAVDHRRQPA